MSETKQQWKECKNLFEGEYGKFFVCNFQKVEPWWYNSAQFDKSSVRHIVTMNGTTIESEMPWYDSWQFKVKADEAAAGFRLPSTVTATCSLTSAAPIPKIRSVCLRR